MNQPQLFKVGPKKKPERKPRANKDEMDARWAIAEAICRLAPGERDSMGNKPDRNRILGYAKLAWEKGARSAHDIERAVHARLRVFPQVRITAASIGNRYGDYAAYVRAGTVTESDYRAVADAGKRERTRINAEHAVLDATRDEAITAIPPDRLQEVLAAASAEAFGRPHVPVDWRNRPFWRFAVCVAWKGMQRSERSEKAVEF